MDVWEVWSRLGRVGRVRFEARPHSHTNSGWSGTGDGAVEVERPDDLLRFVFHERGTWTPKGGRRMPFRNVFRCTAPPTAAPSGWNTSVSGLGARSTCSTSCRSPGTCWRPPNRTPVARTVIRPG